MSMYGTTVGIEMLEKKRNDMALILDERQVVQKGFGKGQELVEQVVYMIAGGKGKLRGKKDGGMQDTGMWRTVALISGEESLSKDGSQTGVYSRSLPVYGRPFDKKEDAASCYRPSGMLRSVRSVDPLHHRQQETDTGPVSQPPYIRGSWAEREAIDMRRPIRRMPPMQP